MITGHVPFPGGSLPEKLYSHQTIEPEPLPEIVPEVPAGLVEIVSRMMRKKPDDRFATPLQVAHALEPFAEDAPPSSIEREATPTIVASSVDDKTIHSAERPLDQAPTYTPPEPDRVSQPEDTAAEAAANPAREAPPASDPERDQPPPAPATGLETGMELPALDPLPFTPGHDPDQEPQWGLLVNTAPPELRPVSTTPRSRAPRPPTAKPKPQFSDKQRKTALVVLVLVAAGVSALIGIQRWPTSDVTPTTKIPPVTVKPPDPTPEPKPTVPDQPAFEFAVVADGDTIPFDAPPDGDRFKAFLDAAKRANGSGGRLLLGSTEPLELKADQSIDFSTGIGQLTLNAAPKKRPVILVEMAKRSKPVIRTGSSVRLNLLDITFIARYSGDPGPVSTLIETGGGQIQIERCSFRVENPTEPRRLHAISADGGSLTIKNCLFQDFWSAIRFYAFAGSKGMIEQSIIVSHPKAEGWAIELQSRGKATVGADRQLRLNHDTIEGLGFLDLTEGENAPCSVTVDHCAVRADALLAWKPTNPDNPRELPADSLRWNGQNNLYEIHGPNWVWLKPRGERTPAFRVDITSLDEWLKRMTGEESPIRARLDFAKDHNVTPAPGNWQPKDYTIESNLVGVTQTGANPKAVGPDDQ
jgi:serine/threonine-protein kinase